MSILLALSLPEEKGKEVVKLLVKLGASSAQADVNHYTAFHFVVAQGREDILDILLSDDKPIALSVLDNVGSGKCGREGSTPLTTAINGKNQQLVKKLLELGARADTKFDDWVKTYLAQNPEAKNHTSEQVQSTYCSRVQPPIVGAAIMELGQSIEELLKHGADPKVLERSAWSVVENPQNGTHQVAWSILDIVQAKLKQLRK